MRADQRGFSFVEVLVGLGIAVMAGFIIYQVSSFVVSQGTEVRKKAQLQKVVRSLVSQITTAYHNVPAIPFDGRFRDPNFQPFDDPNLSDYLCYTVEGAPVDPADKRCYFQAAFYRVQMHDTSFPASSDLGWIPLTRLFIRIMYPDPLVKGQIKKFHLSQFMTSVLSQ